MDSFKSGKRATFTKRPSSVMSKGDGEAVVAAAEKKPRMDISSIESCILANNALLTHIRSVQEENEELKERNLELKNQIETVTTENRHLKCKLRIAQPTKMYLTIKRKNELIRHWRAAFYQLKSSHKTAWKFIEKLDVKKSRKLKLPQAKMNRQSHKGVLTKKVHFFQNQPVVRQRNVASPQTDLPLPEDQFRNCLDGDAEADVMKSEGNAHALAADEAGLHLLSSGTSDADSDTPETLSQKTKRTNGLSNQHTCAQKSEGTAKSGNPAGVEVDTRDHTYHLCLHQQVPGKNDEPSPRNKDSSTGIGTTQTPSSTDTSSCPRERSDMIPAVATMELHIKTEKDHDNKINNPKRIEINETGREQDSDDGTTSELDTVISPDLQFVEKENSQALHNNEDCPSEVSGNRHTYKHTQSGIPKDSAVPSEKKTDQITVHVSNVITDGADDNLNFPLVDSANHIKEEEELMNSDFHVIPVGWQDPLLDVADKVVCHEPLQSTRKASQDNASVFRALRPTNLSMRASADLLDYQLPALSAFPTVLQRALMEKTRSEFRLGKRLKGVLIEKLFDSIVQKNVWFPSRRGYEKVCTTLLKKYGWLPGDISVWRNALRTKFKYARRFLANEDTVLEMRKKYGRPGMSGRKRTVTAKDNEGSQQPEDGNDERTEKEEEEIKQHLSILQEEAKKQSMNIQIINEKMEKTKNYRKQYALSHTVSQILQTFPVLRLRPYLIGEPFMQHNIMVRGKFEKMLEALPNLELRARYRCNSYRVYKHQLNNTIGETTDVKAQQALQLLFAFRLLPSLFGESEHYIIVDSDQKVKSRDPVIVHEGGFNIMVEGQRLLNVPCQTFTLAAEAWFSSFWTFGLDYPKSVRNTCKFIDYAILERTSACPTTVKHFAFKLFN